MKSYVIFNVLKRLYGIEIECVKRIVPAQFLTAIPDEDAYVEGMFKYEDQIIKVLSFRKLIGEKSYEEELVGLFPRFTLEFKEWIDALEESVIKGTSFSKSTDPRVCELGKWLGSFHPDHKDVVEAIKKLDTCNQNMHRSAAEVLEHRRKDPQGAQKSMEEVVRPYHKDIIDQMAKVSKMSDKVSASMQRCLVLVDNEGNLFGINIDAVDDIVHVDEDGLHAVNGSQAMGEFMNVAGILEHNKKLITIVKDIRMNKRSK